jgi:hypothetical protein
VQSVVDYSSTDYFRRFNKLIKYLSYQIKNFCCRFVCKLKKFNDISARIQELHWLKMYIEINYQLSVSIRDCLVPLLISKRVSGSL